jgi:hypothetical protein
MVNVNFTVLAILMASVHGVHQNKLELVKRGSRNRRGRDEGDFSLVSNSKGKAVKACEQAGLSNYDVVIPRAAYHRRCVQALQKIRLECAGCGVVVALVSLIDNVAADRNHERCRCPSNLLSHGRHKWW